MGKEETIMKAFRLDVDRVERVNRVMGKSLLFTGIKNSDVEFYTILIDLGLEEAEKMLDAGKPLKS